MSVIADPLKADTKTDETNTMVFKTEDERLAALTELPEPEDLGVGRMNEVDRQKAEEEHLAKIEAIQNAKIDPDYQGEPGGGTESKEKKPDESQKDKTGGGTPSYIQKDWTVGEGDIPKDDEFTFSNAKDALNSIPHAQRHIKTLKSEKQELVSDYESRLSTSASDLNKAQDTIKDMEQKLKDGVTKKDEPVIPKPEDIKAVQDELDKIDQDIDKIEDPVENPEAFKLSQKQNRLQRKLQNLKDQIFQAEIRKSNQRWEDNSKQSKIDRDATVEKDRTDKADKDKTALADRAIVALNEFRDKSEDFKSKRDYIAMEKDFGDFGVEVAAAIFGKIPEKVSPQEMEIAMARYMANDKTTLDAVLSRGVRPPEDLQEFIVLSDVDRLRIGFQLNKASGQWEETKDPITKRRVTFPNFISAYEEWKRINGLKAIDELKIREDERNQILGVISKRAPVELEPGEGSQSGDADKGMSKEEAFKVFNALEEQGITDEKMAVIARANPNDPRFLEYNKAMVALGNEAIDPKTL